MIFPTVLCHGLDTWNNLQIKNDMETWRYFFYCQGSFWGKMQRQRENNRVSQQVFTADSLQLYFVAIVEGKGNSGTLYRLQRGTPPSRQKKVAAHFAHQPTTTSWLSDIGTSWRNLQPQPSQAAALVFVQTERYSQAVNMSAAQLLNPKAESRVRTSTYSLSTSQLIRHRGGVKLSRSISVPVRVCRMSSSPTWVPWARSRCKNATSTFV